MQEEITKTVDARGRVNIGPVFAGKHVILRTISEGECLIELARVIPEREAWLLDNHDARESIERGLKQAAAGDFVEPPPNLENGLDLCEELDGDE